MKGGVAAILGARAGARRRRRRSRRSTASCSSRSCPSEEDGGQGTLAAIRAGATGDMAIIPEPSSLDIVVAHAGAITFRLTVPGRAAHASRRREGVSALDNLQTSLGALEADEARRNAAETRAADDRARAAVPDDRRDRRGRRVGVDRHGPGRRPTAATASGSASRPRDAEAELRACIAAACAADEFLRDHPATVEITGGAVRSSRVPADHPLPAASPRVAERVDRPRAARSSACPYGADMRLFIDVGDTPVRDLRPGRRPASPTAPTSPCRSTRSRRAPGSSPNG